MAEPRSASCTLATLAVQRVVSRVRATCGHATAGLERQRGRGLPPGDGGRVVRGGRPSARGGRLQRQRVADRGRPRRGQVSRQGLKADGPVRLGRRMAPLASSAVLRSPCPFEHTAASRRCRHRPLSRADSTGGGKNARCRQGSGGLVHNEDACGTDLCGGNYARQTRSRQASRAS